MRNPALDGVRGIAILLVMLDHWAPDVIIHNVGEWGRMGVLLFFILSGYLITNILLQYSNEIKGGTVSSIKALKVFYIRRSLRIFPIYFLAVGIIILTIPIGPKSILSHIVFLQNIAAAFQPMGQFGAAAPLWSLAVEEQFYLLWAPVILFFPSSRQIQIGLVMIVASFCFKSYATISGESLWFVRLITFGNLEGFAIGAFTAIGRRHERGIDLMGRIFRIASIAGPLMLVCIGIITYANGYVGIRKDPYYMVFFDWAAFSSLWALMYASLVPNRLNGLLRIQPLPFIGVISYGLYVWHQFVRMFAIIAFEVLFNITLPHTGSYLSLSIFFPLTFIVAILSWRLVETPFNNLKRGYVFEAGKREAGATPAPSP